MKNAILIFIFLFAFAVINTHAADPIKGDSASNRINETEMMESIRRCVKNAMKRSYNHVKENSQTSVLIVFQVDDQGIAKMSQATGDNRSFVKYIEQQLNKVMFLTDPSLVGKKYELKAIYKKYPYNHPDK